MYYTADLLINNLKEKLNGLEIFVKKIKDKNYFILDYKGKKAKIDFDSFLVRLDKEKTKASDDKLSFFIHTIINNLKIQDDFQQLNLDRDYILKNVFPILRAVSFAKDKVHNFLTKHHTNETKIFYSLDLGTSYKILEQDILKDYNISFDTLDSQAKKNLSQLTLKYNTDEVFGNTFYFLNAKDGYDGARLLDDKVLNYFYQKIGTAFYVGIPHQDSLIIADIKNKKGLEILQKLMVHFFTEGSVPITTITFKYNGESLESLFIFVE